MRKSCQRRRDDVSRDDDAYFRTLTPLAVLGLCAYTRLRYERWRAPQNQDANQDGGIRTAGSVLSSIHALPR